jgi:deoxyribonuclease-4
MRFGVHISISGKLNDVVNRAIERTCETFQIFTRNPRGWASPKKATSKEIEGFKLSLQKENIYPLIVHLPYLPNIASPNDELYQKTVDMLCSELRQAELLGSPFVVVHAGNHGGKGEEFGISRAIQALNFALNQIENEVLILLENMSGQGSELGYKLEQLKQIIDEIDKKDRVGVCFDLCHAFVSGYDVASRKGLDETLKIFDELIGLEKLKILHANDSKAQMGSKLDRHADIGEGYIGRDGFKNIVNHPILKGKPVVLETPVMTIDDDLRNLRVIRSLVED